MGIKDYLEFVSSGESGGAYPRISVTGLARQETNIDYIEMRPDGDYVCLMNGNSAPLGDITRDAGMPAITSIRNLTRTDLVGKQLGLAVKIDDARVSKIPLDNRHLLDIGELAASLVTEGRLTERTGGDSAQI